MRIDPRPCLDDLEHQIDESVERPLHEQWAAFCHDRIGHGAFTPKRPRAIPPGIEWPPVRINASAATCAGAYTWSDAPRCRNGWKPCRTPTSPSNVVKAPSQAWPGLAGSRPRHLAQTAVALNGHFDLRRDRKNRIFSSKTRFRLGFDRRSNPS